MQQAQNRPTQLRANPWFYRGLLPCLPSRRVTPSAGQQKRGELMREGEGGGGGREEGEESEWGKKKKSEG